MVETFVEFTTRAFSFLLDAGYRQILDQSNHVVRYESDKVSIDVVWDPRSGELDALVGLLTKTAQNRAAYSVSDVLALIGKSQASCITAQVSQENKLGPFIEKIAHDLRVHAQLALAGDRMYFRRLETFSDAKVKSYALQLKLKNVRAKAAKAWQNKQYHDVIKLYGSIESELTKSETLKLHFARRQ